MRGDDVAYTWRLAIARAALRAVGYGKDTPNDQLARDEQLTIRIAYKLFTQNKGKELDDFKRWTGMVKPGDGSDY